MGGVNYQHPTIGAPQSQTVGISTRTGRLMESGGTVRKKQAAQILHKITYKARFSQLGDSAFGGNMGGAESGRAAEELALGEPGTAVAS